MLSGRPRLDGLQDPRGGFGEPLQGYFSIKPLNIKRFQGCRACVNWEHIKSTLRGFLASRRSVSYLWGTYFSQALETMQTACLAGAFLGLGTGYWKLG